VLTSFSFEVAVWLLLKLWFFKPFADVFFVNDTRFQASIAISLGEPTILWLRMG